MVEYKVNTASAGQIAAFLQECDGDFALALSRKVNIAEYGAKLKDKAENFEAWDGDKLIGLVSAYMNDFATKQAFLSMVCVAPAFRGKGIGRWLMHDFINAAAEKGFYESKLEVDKNNVYAIALYKALGYVMTAGEGGKDFMVRKGRKNA